MKKILLLFILISGFAFSQFTVSDQTGSWVKVGNYLSLLELYKKSDNTKAKIVYADFNVALSTTNIFSPTVYYEFEFSTEPDTLDRLYKLLSSGLDTKREDNIVLTFPEGEMGVNFQKALGKYYVGFEFKNQSGLLDKNAVTKRETYPLNKKRLDKLFEVK